MGLYELLLEERAEEDQRRGNPYRKYVAWIHRCWPDSWSMLPGGGRDTPPTAYLSLLLGKCRQKHRKASGVREIRNRP